MKRLLPLILLLLSLSAQAQIAFEQSASSSVVGSTGTVGFATDVTVDSLIVIKVGHAVAGGDAYATGDVTVDAGSTATLDTIQLDSGNFGSSGELNQDMSIFSALVTSGGSLTIDLSNLDGTSHLTALVIEEYSGNWDGTRVEDESGAIVATNDTTTAATGTATSAGAALFTAGITTIGGTAEAITPGGGFTETEEATADGAGGDTTINAVYSIVATGTTDEAEWTLGGSNFGHHSGLVVYREVVASGDTSLRRRRSN